MNGIYQMRKDKLSKFIDSLKCIKNSIDEYNLEVDEYTTYEIKTMIKMANEAYPRAIMSGFLTEDGEYEEVRTDGGHAVYAYNLVKKVKKEAGDHLEALDIVKNMKIIAIHEDYITFPKSISFEQKNWLFENKKFLNKEQKRYLEEFSKEDRKLKSLLLKQEELTWLNN